MSKKGRGDGLGDASDKTASDNQDAIDAHGPKYDCDVPTVGPRAWLRGIGSNPLFDHSKKK